ncbi:NADase-type glycan-binding domain-containing protein [Streptomyces sp. NPDC085481]|uniref:NADase-type glycan-binding domain-containing protein n=1 Tax=Streptomyces sp. NPDC085481 TaxID=3365727 RepID=UPI0037D82002
MTTLRECPACGASNGPADDFCGNCGAYLGWSPTSPGAGPTRPPAPNGGTTPVDPEVGGADGAGDWGPRGDSAGPGAQGPEDGAPEGAGAREPVHGDSAGTGVRGSGDGDSRGGTAPGPGSSDAVGTAPRGSGTGDTTGAARRGPADGGAAEGTAAGGRGDAESEGTDARGAGRPGRASSDARGSTARSARSGGAEGTSPRNGTGNGGSWSRPGPQSGESERGAHRAAATGPADSPSRAHADPTGRPATEPEAGPAAHADPTGRSAAEPEASPTPPPEAGPARGEGQVGRWSRRRERAPHVPPGPPRTTALSRPETAPRPPAAPEAEAPAPVSPRVAARPAAAPVADPAPVQPAKAVAPRPVVRPAVVGDDVAGVPCPACGTPNPPDRRFCRRCAAPLTPATAQAPLPWWRTVWPFRRRTRAGSGRLTRFLVVLAVVLALCAGGFLLLPAGRHLIEDTRDKLGKAKAVTPTRVEASAQSPGHPADDTTDGLSNRYWGAPGPGASVTYTFAKPFRLVDVIITNGASSSPEEYARQGRALQVDMEVTARDGRKVVKKLSLSDKPGPQTFPTGISDVTTIRLTLDAAAGLVKGRHIALAEVEFFQRG